VVPLGSVPGLTFGALVDPQTDFADTALEGSNAWGVGANVGLIWKATDAVRFGARYLSRINLTYNGTATFNPVQTSIRVTKPNPLGLPVGTPLDAAVSQVLASLPNQDGTTQLPMPSQFTAGVSVHPTSHLTIFGDYQWIGWAAFESLTLDFSQPLPPDEVLVQNYRNTNAVKVAAELTRQFKGAPLQLRGGYFYNQAAAPDETVTPILPDAARHHVTAGVGLPLTSKASLDVGYMFVHVSDRRGRVVDAPSGQVPTAALNSGVYSSSSNLLSVSFTYRP
jgi:long-chain fatty acid transport protein